MSQLLLFGISLLGLIIAAGLLIQLTKNLASSIRISPLVIGATLVAAGTSLPETAVAISSIMQKVPSISIGNIIGSNIANICLIFGISIIFFPIEVGTHKTQRNNIILLGLTLFFASFYFIPNIVRSNFSYFLLAFYVIFILVEIIWGEEGKNKEDKKALDKLKKPKYKPVLIISGILFSLALLFVNSKIFVSSAVRVAGEYKINNEVIGLTLVALGTTIPELFTTIVSGIRKEWKILLGDIQGTNIYNLSVLGALVVKQDNFQGQGHYISIIYLIIISIIFFFITRGFEGTSIPKSWGFLFISSYILYLTLII